MKSVHTCLWKEPPEACERVVFVECDWKYHVFLNIKTEEWDQNISLFIYWNGLVLGSVEVYLLEVSAYVPLKITIAGVWEGCFWWVWLEISHFLNIKTEEWDLKVLLFNFSNDFFIGSVKTIFGTRWIHICERSHRRCVRGSFLLNLTGNFNFFEI